MEKKFKTIDRELKDLIRKQKQERWLELFLILCQLDAKKDIEHISYKRNELYVRYSDGKTTLYLV